MKIKVASFIGLAGFVIASSANAAVVVDISQTGSSVTVTSLGSFNTTGLVRPYVVNGTGVINPSAGLVATGAGLFDDFATTFINRPTIGDQQFGGATFSSSDLGLIFGVAAEPPTTGSPGGTNGSIELPINYISNSPLFSSSVFANTTLSSLGLVSGSYLYQNAVDSVTVNIGQTVAAAPEPATWAMMIVGFGLAGTALRRRKAVRTTVSFA